MVRDLIDPVNKQQFYNGVMTNPYDPQFLEGKVELKNRHAQLAFEFCRILPSSVEDRTHAMMAARRDQLQGSYPNVFDVMGEFRNANHTWNKVIWQYYNNATANGNNRARECHVVRENQQVSS